MRGKRGRDETGEDRFRFEGVMAGKTGAGAVQNHANGCGVAGGLLAPPMGVRWLAARN
jgi:hypothetical protein